MKRQKQLPVLVFVSTLFLVLSALGSEFASATQFRLEVGPTVDASVEADAVQDGSFEAGTPNPVWSEFSTNYGTPLCSASTCGTGGTVLGPRTGDWWAWFGGADTYEEGVVAQYLTIPEARSAVLAFWLELPSCDSPVDYLEVSIDGTQVFFINGSSPLCDQIGYTQQTVDVSDWADGGLHNLELHSEISGSGVITNFFVDDVSLETANFSIPCPLEAALFRTPNELTNLRALRQSRDQVMAATDAGRAYVDLYYTHALELSWMMVKDADLRARVRDAVEHYMPALRDMNQGRKGTVLTAGDVADIDALLGAIAVQSSAELQADLAGLRTELAGSTGKTLRQVWDSIAR